ncbi:hypothetical protein MMC10_004600 [Thelotrema lepadinum]|nr:hypothetical protein [Thelotrema lepadinum]
MGTPLHIDGTTLEGGGQLFRLALSLSALTAKPIRITDIRGKRGGSSKTGKDGGIKPAHYAGAAWLARATRATTNGLEVKSKELLFCPTRQAEAQTANQTDSNQDPEVWEDVFESGKLVRRETKILMRTAGSVFLILQAILPYILFYPTASGSQDPDPVPLRLFIEGGTNVWHSLSFEYADQVLFPILQQKLGLGPFKLKLHKRGWSTGSTSIGKIQLDLLLHRSDQALPAFSLVDRGEIVKFRASILAPDNRWRNELRDSVVKKILQNWPDVDIDFPVDDFSGNQKRIYLLLVAESSNGYLIGRDWLYDEKTNIEKPGKTIERLVSKVIGDMEAEIDHGGCVDEWLQDQLVVFQALAEGKSIIEGRDPSLHTQTARWLAEEMLDIDFDKQGHCKGVAFTAKPRSQDGSLSTATDTLEQLKI